MNQCNARPVSIHANFQYFYGIRPPGKVQHLACFRAHYGAAQRRGERQQPCRRVRFVITNDGDAAWLAIQP